MYLPSVPIGSQTSFIRSIISHSLRIHDGRGRRVLVNGPTALEIDANLETLRMETPRPVEGFGTFKIMPFHTDTFTDKTAKQRSPFPFNAGPDPLLAKLLHAQYKRLHIEN
jgi:hypothetical protein